MNDTDREMLEMAAKAAGIKGVYETGVIWYKNPFGDDAGFNPLNDDGDALRLAVKLKIDIVGDGELADGTPCVSVIFPLAGEYECVSERIHDADPYAATRRAITRTAAAIGKAMP